MIFRLEGILGKARHSANFSRYFIREFGIAKKYYCYEIDDFFPPFYQLIDKYKIEIDQKYEKEKKGLIDLISKANRNELSFDDAYYGKRLEEVITYYEYKKDQNNIMAKDMAKKLANFKVESVTVGFPSQFRLSDLNKLENAIRDAENSLRSKHFTETEHSDTNEHSHIFANNGFILFDYILKHFISVKRGRIADLSFFFWKMHNEKHLHQRPKQFLEWFNQQYQEPIDKIRPYSEVDNIKREKLYSTAKEWLKDKKTDMRP